MIRIAHLSDLHFSLSEIKDTEQFIVKALIKDLDTFHKETNIDMILISGDLIDKGAESFGNDIITGLKKFEEIFINPITERINISKENIFFCPGNHDINRSVDDPIVENGLKQTLVSTESVNTFIDSGKSLGTLRIKAFKEYEGKYYSAYSGPRQISNYQSAFQVSVRGIKIGITCFNTAWRAFDGSDKGNLIVGERQVTNARDIVGKCDLKIALMHHPIDWLATFEQAYMESLLSKDYNILFSGHVHEGGSWSKTGMHGSLFVSTAPANWHYNIRSNDRKNANGYSIVDYDLDNKRVTIHNRRYAYKKECYDPNADLGDDNGKLVIPIPGSAEILTQSEEMKTVQLIRDTHIESTNEHLLSYSTDTKAPKDVEKIFVSPRLVAKVAFDIEKEKEGEEVKYSLDEICNSSENFIVFGTKESGKTVLLDKILLDFTKNVSKIHKIPVFIDFVEIGTTRFETLINRFLGISITEVDTYLNNHRVTMLVDNLTFTKINHYKLIRLIEFIEKFKHVQIIATSSQMFEGDIPLEMLEYPAFSNFNLISIGSFRTGQIKDLIRKWFSSESKFDTPEKLDKILSVIQALNLPRTPLAISMFLWIIEQQENYKPINHATMLENYIERLFKKHSHKEQYSETFDYRNKERLLSDIAHRMFENNMINYRISYNELNNFVYNYFKIKKFDYPAEEVLNHFLVKGILLKENDDSEVYVRFRFSCFFQYFLMKKMEFDNKFKEYVLREENFLNFVDEIDYYTGVKRDQAEILGLLIKRMMKVYEPIISQIMNIQNTFDNIFDIANKSVASTLEPAFIENLNQNRPSEKDLEKVKDEMLDKTPPEKGIQSKDAEISQPLKLERLWSLSAHVLKNTEEITDIGLKDSAYESILICSMAFSNLYKYWVDNYIKKKHSDGQTKIDEHLVVAQKVLPLIHEIVLFSLMGTTKLAIVIRDKINMDMKGNSVVSDFEKYLSVFLYADIRGKDYQNYIKNFVKNIKRTYIYDMTLYKLITYYYIRSKSKESDVFYEELISELIVNAKGLEKGQKSSIMERYKLKKRKRFEETPEIGSDV